jgi:hypothetical protein
VNEAEARAEGRREAAPAALVAFLILAVLALVSRNQGWELLGLAWWIWILLGLPVLLLTIDLALTFRGSGLVRSRRAALVLLGFLVLGNLTALAILVASLVTVNTSDLGGGELLLTAFMIWSTDVIVFGLWFWELDAGGPVARTRAPARTMPDFQFPQDENPQLTPEGWRPQVWDYLYVSLTSASAFSPTDAMPLTLKAKLLMGTESTVSLVLIVLITARAVNVLAS